MKSILMEAQVRPNKREINLLILNRQSVWFDVRRSRPARGAISNGRPLLASTPDTRARLARAVDELERRRSIRN